MRPLRKSLYFLLFAISFFVCSDNDVKEREKIEQITTSQAYKDFISQQESYKDFFPFKLDIRWTYEIIVKNQPLFYHIESWPLGDNVFSYDIRGTYTKEKKTYLLIFEVEKTAAKQGPLEYPQGVKLSVIKDELGIFKYAKEVYWAINTYSRNAAHVVITYPPHMPGAPVQNVRGGYYIQLLFFIAKPGSVLSLGEDELLFVGLEPFQDQLALHFKRTVSSGEDKGYIQHSFIEDSWYQKGKGLVYLEQKVDDITTMIFRLKDLKKGDVQ